MYVASDERVYTNSRWDEPRERQESIRTNVIDENVVNYMVREERRVAVTASSDYLYVSIE